MSENQKKLPLIVLAGPTAVGKSELSIKLARRIGAEIISADSMQVYRGMDIGTAKITKDKMQGIPHFLIDELDPKEEFHVMKFQEAANCAIQKILGHDHIPMLVGGSGFYIQSVLYGIDFTEGGSDKTTRESLEKLAKEKGPEALHEMLFKVDPKSAQKIHANNVKRVIRALEFYYETGTRISDHNEAQKKKESPYRYVYFVLNEERSVLYHEIDRRVDEMVLSGFPDEVRALKDSGCTEDMTSMQALGYREIFSYLKGEITLEEAVEQMKSNTRHFAKRQLTWFKRQKDAIWLDKGKFGYDDEKILEDMTEILKEKKIWLPKT